MIFGDWEKITILHSLTSQLHDIEQNTKGSKTIQLILKIHSLLCLFIYKWMFDSLYQLFCSISKFSDTSVQ